MENKYVNNIRKRIGKTIYKQGLINKGDKILVALSGGKDSLILLESLVDRKKYMPFSFELSAIHINIKNIDYQTDIKYLSNFCQELKVPFILKEFEVDLSKDNKKGMCFICSWNRRKSIFEATKELAFTKLAFGHHMDDALETLFMNMIYHGSISSLPFKFSMFNNRIEVIRPLLELNNEELNEYARIRDFKGELKRCAYENTSRQKMKILISRMAELNPVARKNIFRSMSNTFDEYLPMYVSN